MFFLLIQFFISPQHFIGKAKKDTKKVITYLLHAFNTIQKELEEPQVLVILPTKELVDEVYDVAAKLGKYTGIKITPLYLDEKSKDEDIKSLFFFSFFFFF